MEKILQILAVFGLLMLLIWRSMRAREERFRRFSFLGRVKAELEEQVGGRMINGVFRETGRTDDPEAAAAGRGDSERIGVPDNADGWLSDEEGRLVMSYSREGKLTIGRRTSGSHIKELQEMSVPMDCTGLGWDPVERRIYLKESADWFVYGEEG
ncbi:MAG TPA: hypothetical protein VMH27_06335 [Puia sp.]|nr:hypothetical protein [Puia sp.]